jgi:hypothetical protein
VPTLYYPDGSGSVDVPAIDAPGWLQVHGMLLEPPLSPQEQPNGQALQEKEAPQGQTLNAAVLALINSAEYAYELKPIPTVGEAAAGLIIAQRPEGGYTSLEDLPGEIFKRPYRTNLDSIKGWGGVDANPA